MEQTLESFLSLTKRPRRNRKSAAIREITQETRLLPSDLIAPLFVVEGIRKKEPIHSMPEVFRLSIDLLIQEVRELYLLGIRGINLFPFIPKEVKDDRGSEAVRHGNLISQAIRAIKEEIPEMCLMVDIALDPYTSHGHDGLVDESGRIVNDETLEVLAQMSLLAAEAGADVVAPSDMMDGRIGYIRKELDRSGFQDVSILSYAVKFASAFYGPFRDALESAPRFGDKKTYQLNPGNRREALMECLLDDAEGADMLLIKPALPYLDILSAVRAQTHLPLGAYHVSGEYAMIMAAAEKGWIEGSRAMSECLLSIKRAGADFILTYAAKKMAEKLST